MIGKSHCLAFATALLVAACSGGGPSPSAGLREVVLYRPSNSTFYVRHGDGRTPATELPFGAPGDIPLWADFAGTGKPGPALYRKGEWLISTQADGKADL